MDKDGKRIIMSDDIRTKHRYLRCTYDVRMPVFTLNLDKIANRLIPTKK